MSDPIDNRIGPNFGKPLSQRERSLVKAALDKYDQHIARTGYATAEDMATLAEAAQKWLDTTGEAFACPADCGCTISVSGNPECACDGPCCGVYEPAPTPSNYRGEWGWDD